METPTKSPPPTHPHHGELRGRCTRGPKRREDSDEESSYRVVFLRRKISGPHRHPLREGTEPSAAYQWMQVSEITSVRYSPDPILRTRSALEDSNQTKKIEYTILKRNKGKVPFSPNMGPDENYS
jgi:hypothetical protein